MDGVGLPESGVAITESVEENPTRICELIVGARNWSSPTSTPTENPTRICELIVGLGDVELLGVKDGPCGPLALHIRKRARPACGGCGAPVWSKGARPWGWWIWRHSGTRCASCGASGAGAARQREAPAFAGSAVGACSLIADGPQQSARHRSLVPCSRFRSLNGICLLLLTFCGEDGCVGVQGVHLRGAFPEAG